MGDPTTFVYQFICNENDSYDTNIIQYFIMHGLVLCIKVDNYVAHMLYTWSFSHNTAVTIAINNKNYFLPLSKNTTVFDYGSCNSIIKKCNS